MLGSVRGLLVRGVAATFGTVVAADLGTVVLVAVRRLVELRRVLDLILWCG
jgi:hypothetical protein